MAYEQTEALKRKIESLQNPLFSGQGAGLANAIRARRAKKYEEQLSEAEKRNEANKAQELSMLLKGAETGRVGDFMGAARLDQAQFTDPTIQQLAAELRLKKAEQGPEKPIAVPANSRLYDPASRKTILDAMPDMGGGGSITDLQYYMGLKPGSQEARRAIEFRRNPYLNTGGDFTNPYASGDTLPANIARSLNPGDQPDIRGAQQSAVEQAKTDAIPARADAEIAAEVRRIQSIADPQARASALESLLTGQAENATQANLTPILVDRAAQTQRATGDIETEQGTAQAGAEGLVKSNIERYQSATKAAEGAVQTVRMMDQFIEASANAPAGSMQPVVTMVKNFIASTGGNPSGLTDTALAQAAMAGTLVPMIMDSGARLTDSDREVLERYGPQLATSREAREAVANTLKQSALRTLEDFDALERQMRQSPIYSQYILDQPFMSNWRNSRQPSSSEDIIKAADDIINGN